MGSTARGIDYPDSTAHVRTWEHWQTLAESTDDAISGATPTLGRDHHAAVGNTSIASPGTSLATVAIVVPAVAPAGAVLGVVITVRHQDSTMTPFVGVEIDGVLATDLSGSTAARMNPPGAGSGIYYTQTLYLEFALPAAGAHTVEVQGWHNTAGTQNTQVSASVRLA